MVPGANRRLRLDAQEKTARLINNGHENPNVSWSIGYLKGLSYQVGNTKNGRQWMIAGRFHFSDVNSLSYSVNGRLSLFALV